MSFQSCKVLSQPVRRFLPLLLFPFSMLLSAPIMGGGSVDTLYYSSIGAGSVAPLQYQTEFYLINEDLNEVSGELSFISADGTALDMEVTTLWVGEGLEGTVEVLGSQVEFLIPSKVSLVLTLVPGEDPRMGLAKLYYSGNLASQVRVQVANVPDKVPLLPDFEHYVAYESEVFPTRGVKNVAFPIVLFNGLQNSSTAFSIFNLSALSGNVHLTLRPATTKSVRLEPGQSLSGYFDSFWETAFPEIFPFRLNTAAEVTSEVPLGISVFKTVAGIPVAGLRVVETPLQEEPVQVELDSEFVLVAGQAALFNEAELEINFWDVKEDSRCPIDVVCIQAGQAVVEVRGMDQGHELGSLRLATEAPENIVLIGDYELKLLQVDPSPVSTQKLDITDYRIHLILTQDQSP